MPRQSQEDRPKTRWGRPIVSAVLLVVIPMLLVLVLGVFAADAYTARPQFCGTCHVMKPYYKAWSNDLHGRKLGVRCVDCHYRPGERHTFMAKLRGLSQVFSYFSGRYGAGRPRAHVSDASCLRSRCHGDGAYIAKRLEVGTTRTETRIVDGRTVEVERKPTVIFTHAKHAEVIATLDEVAADRQQLEQRLVSALPDEAGRTLRQLIGAPEPLRQRLEAVTQLLARAGRGDNLPEALKLVRLRDRETRLRQLAGLKCTACHVFDETTQHHMRVNTTTCFTCHFTNQPFNANTGKCTHCHEPPQRKVMVHEALPGTATQAVFMDHRELVERKVDCRACHLDVVRGQARVLKRSCTACHDQARYLEGFDDKTLEDVERYHAVHVARQRARCEDCHNTIEHSLVDPVHVASSSRYIEMVRRDCQHCHPNHHSEQVTLLMGKPLDGVSRPMPNPMFGSRINCQACHIESGEDFVGDPLVQATADACVQCHGDDGRKKFERWRSELASRLDETVSLRKALDAKVAEVRRAGQPLPAALAATLRQVDQALHLVRAGNGIHNWGYSIRLLDSTHRTLRKLYEQLSAPAVPPAGGASDTGSD